MSISAASFGALPKSAIYNLFLILPSIVRLRIKIVNAIRTGSGTLARAKTMNILGSPYF